ncbi:Frag1/DRAM/Sfk1 [Mucidula mucida]|nr:Frag1/DRAM/Sfk1 [Mucidula mucida]
MATLAHRHWAYVWIPIVGAFMWFSTLLAMLITYFATGSPHYVSMDGSIPYISDIGADILKPLFIVGCSFTAVGFFLSLSVERALRHHGRLVPGMRRREKVFGYLAIVASFVGGCGLILLSIFDTKRYTTLHRLFLLIFILGVAFSALFTVIEYRWLSKDYRFVRELRHAYIAKAVIATVLVVLAIAFGIALYKSTDVGGVLEWVISFGFTFYLLTFFFDLRQSKGVQDGQLRSNSFVMRARSFAPRVRGRDRV